MIVHKFISLLTILQLIRVYQLVPIELNSKILTAAQVVTLPKEWRSEDRILTKASESVRDRFLPSDRYLLVDEASDPFIAIGDSVDIDPDCNSEEKVPNKEESDEPDILFDNSAILEFLQIILQLIAKSEHFVDVLWQSIDQCRACEIPIDRAQFDAMLFKLRETHSTRIEFNEDLFRQWNCHQIIMNRRTPFDGYNGHRWVKGGYKYGGYEPSLWPRTRHDKRIQGATHLQGRKGHGDRRQGKNYIPSDVHTSTISTVNKRPGEYQTTTTAPSNATPTTTPHPTQSKESYENKTTTTLSPTIEENTTTTFALKSTPKAPLFDDSTPLLKSRPPQTAVPRREKPIRGSTKKPKPFLWHIGRDLRDYEESRRNEAGVDHEDYDYDNDDEFKVRWKDFLPG